MKKVIFFLNIFISVFHFGGFAQQAQWAKFMGGMAGSKGREIQADANGNVYSVGDYSFNFNTGAVDFDPGPGVFAFTQPTNTGSSYISKLDANGNFVWARSFTNNGVSGASINKLCLDADGNILISGVFVGTVDFNLGAGVFNVTSYAPPTNSDNFVTDFFIAKYSSAGNFIWVKTFACEPFQIVPGYSITNGIAGLSLDEQNNIILAGSFRGRVDLNPASAEEWKVCDGLNYNSIVIKLNNQGDYIWGKHFEGGFNTCSSIAIDAQKNIYVNGGYSQGVDFEPGAGENWIQNYSLSDSYILKMSPNGDVLWMNKIYGPYGGYGGCVDIALDEVGNVLATGDIVRDSLYFRSFTDSLFLLKSNSFIETGYNAFVTKIDSNGHFLWIKRMASNAEFGVSGRKIECDSLSNVYVCGQFADSADFDYSGSGAVSYATGDYSSFLMKLDADGNFIRNSIIDGNRYVNCSDFSLDKQANIYFTGFFNVVNFDMGFPWGVMVGTGQIDFDPGPDTLAMIGLGNGPETVFVAKWNQCSLGTTTTNETACNNFTWNNEVYSESGSYSKSLTTALGCDSISNLNLNILNSAQASQNIQLCAGETYSIGNQIFNQSGVYQSTLTAQNGCDSLLTTTLFIDTLEAQISSLGQALQVTNIPINVNLQWLDCNTNFSLLLGETNQIFIPTVNGNYAVIVNNTSCSDTSECFPVFSVGLPNVDDDFHVLFYPNPVKDVLTFSLKNNPSKAGVISIYDLNGEIIYTTTSTKEQINVSHLASGVYILCFKNDNTVFHQKVIKQ